jgi:N-methylhydantoinase A
VDERILVDGIVDRPLTNEEIERVAVDLSVVDIEAIAICLLWSVRNSAHEAQLKAVLTARMRGIEISLSSEVNPTLREFRRASATVIDASLKGFVRTYVNDLSNDLQKEGLRAPILLVGSDGSLMAPAQAIEHPIALINSGPAMAPHAVLNAVFQGTRRDLIVSDTGGTTFDVSVVRRGTIPVSSETYVGSPRLGLFCGYPSVDIQSVGAGGGSIAWVDQGGLLRLGPQSAGADPGPACYGRGGTEPTLTDAALVRGIIDPARFLGGRLKLFPSLAASAISPVAEALGLDVREAATRIMMLGTELMARTVEETVARHGVDPSRATFVGGGGAAGLNVVRLAKMLGCRQILFPFSSPVLSAYGMTVAPLSAESRAVFPIRSTVFNAAEVTKLLTSLKKSAAAKLPVTVATSDSLITEYFTYARYEGQVWEIELPFGNTAFLSSRDFINSFHGRHRELYSFDDETAVVEFLSWRVRVQRETAARPELSEDKGSATLPSRREVHLENRKVAYLPIYWLEAGALIAGVGPAVIETEYSTIFVEEADFFKSSPNGDLEVNVG